MTSYAALQVRQQAGGILDYQSQAFRYWGQFLETNHRSLIFMEAVASNLVTVCLKSRSGL